MREALRHAGIADGLYEIGGMHRAANPGNGFDFIEERNGEWLVGYEERGERGVVARFGTEDEVCRYFYDQLIKIWTPRSPHRQTPEEEERGRRITEESVRRLKDLIKRTS